MLAAHSLLRRTLVGGIVVALLAAACGDGTAADPEDASRGPAIVDGTAAMAARLAGIAASADPNEDSYLTDQRIAMFRERLAAGVLDPGKRLETRVQLANTLISSGDPLAAVTELEGVLADLDAPDSPIPKSMRVNVLEVLGLAWLRLGEQDNCVAHHGTASCLAPIEDDGVHDVTRGSENAIAVFEEVLDKRGKSSESAWLLNIAYMTLGRWPDDVPPGFLIPVEAFASEDDIGRFVDEAAARGADVMGLCGGVCLEDFDGDGDLDVLASSWSLDDPLRYLVNDGTGHFTDASSEAGLDGLTGGLNMIHADHDNDGDADVLVLRGAWRGESGRVPNSLLRNRGDGTFEDVTEAAGLLSFHPTQTAAWGDYDGDGWLDLFIGNETTPFAPTTHACELYHNDGDGTFTEVSGAAGLRLEGYVKGVAWGDYDDDGRPDLYLSRNDGPNVLLRNLGPRDPDEREADMVARAARAEAAPERGPAAPVRPWFFRDVTQKAGVSEPQWSFPTWWFDYDNDGRLDLWVSGYQFNATRWVAKDYQGKKHKGELPRLYRNTGNGSFEDVSADMGLDVLLNTMGCNFGDLDNDGWLDFYAGTGEPDFRSLYPNRMFRNDAGRRFLDVTTSGGFGHLQKGHGVAFGDVDGDGDQDVYAVMGGAFTGDGFVNALFVNPGQGNHWIAVHLEGVTSNRPAIGARIRVTVERPDGALRDVYHTVGTGGSFGSSPLLAEIGLGEAKAVRHLEVRWPSGRTESFPVSEVDRRYDLREGDGS